MNVPLPFDADEVERRKQLFRDLWAGRPLDHVPVLINVVNPTPRYAVRAQFQDADKQLEEALRGVSLTWTLIPESDTVPAMRPDVGCSCLATAFGSQLFWGEDSDQTCGVREPILHDVEEAYALAVPPADAGQLEEGTRRVARFADAGQGLVSVSLLDMAGGLNVAADLLGSTELYLAMREKPEALECLLAKIQDLYLAAIERQIKAAGGQQYITTTDFPDYWFPEGSKGHVSDDISANISPKLYARFSTPFHNRVLARYGGGGLHNCGPNPCLDGYMSHTPPLRCLDLSYPYSRNDLPAIKRACAGRAFVILGGFPAAPDEAVNTFREIMDLLAPDVVGVPALSVAPDSDPSGLYRRMRVVADEYARRMNWGWRNERQEVRKA
jgi:hypothetical protein